MLEFTEDDLFRPPAVLEDAMEPGMLFHGHFFGVAPEFSDKRIRGLHLRHGFHTSCERSPWRGDGSERPLVIMPDPALGAIHACAMEIADSKMAP